ncbi:hypothetical protein A3H85_02190, partial [Candidatus Daviesbacteria bacterium RIFCSPLOWO2_02_FULL_40_8]
MQKSFGSSNPSTDPGQTLQSNSDLTDKQAELAKREGILEERERQNEGKSQLLAQKLDASDKVRQDLLAKLEKVSSISLEEAKKLLLENLEKDLASEVSKKIREAEDQIKLATDEKSKELLADAMMHGLTDYVAEFTTSTVTLPDEETKGRIIGKEGRNIRTFEQSTGVDVLMDETPGVLILSSFDPVRREIARVSLERLLKDGRIQPQRIEEIVEATKQDIEKIMLQEGERLCHQVGVYNLPAELVTLIGRFKYRYSYGQNLIQHTLEETKIGIALAAELGANVNIVKLACLLHDIGKVAYEDADEGTHVDKGVQVLKKYNLPQEVINCVAEHHEDQPFSSVESVVAYLADAISGSRPGAR